MKKTNEEGVELLKPRTKRAEYKCDCGNEMVVVFIGCKVINNVECDQCNKRAKLIASE